MQRKTIGGFVNMQQATSQQQTEVVVGGGVKRILTIFHGEIGRRETTKVGVIGSMDLLRPALPEMFRDPHIHTVEKLGVSPWRQWRKSSFA